jgi:DNA-binding response OmpR family regulator
MQQEPLIAIVDDDEEIRNLLGRYLQTQGFRISLAADQRGLAEQLARGGIDLIVLDVLLPDGSGLDVCRRLRAEASTVPVILLTALKEDVDRIIGLEIGADDYLGKPFNPRELVARIRAILRRLPHGSAQQADAARVFRFEGFVLDPATRRVRRPDGCEIGLTGAEFDLLHSLLDRPGRVLSRERLFELTKGRDGNNPVDRSIDVLMSRLRRKLAESGAAHLIKTVRNGGYQLAAHVDVASR